MRTTHFSSGGRPSAAYLAAAALLFVATLSCQPEGDPSAEADTGRVDSDAPAQIARTSDAPSNARGDVWIDPAFENAGSASVVAVVWFDRQLIGADEPYLESTERFEGLGRAEIREQVLRTLKAMSDSSYAEASAALGSMESNGTVRECRWHWIVNAVSCVVPLNQGAQLAELPGAWKVFRATNRSRPSRSSFPEVGPEFAPESGTSEPFDASGREVGWSVDLIGAPRVWEELGITGRGVLTVFSDFGFKFDAPNTLPTLYRNAAEIPANGTDDDENGYVDDVHGFNFDAGSSALNRARVNSSNSIHGNATATVVSGRAASDTDRLLGLAPDSRWAGMIAVNEVEAGIEWALEQNADIINMSFSLPRLGEYRSHWRKVMEHGALAGLFLVSGAGNFADSSRPSYRPIPEQLGIPEGIPDAVFGVAGLDRDGARPSFSSQGPVLWDTEHYREGEIEKPDFTTYNFIIPVTDVDGLETVVAGNSFAGPHLAGVLALMLEADPEMTPWQATEILRATAQDVLEPGFDMQSGFGSVRAFEAVSEALRHRDER